MKFKDQKIWVACSFSTDLTIGRNNWAFLSSSKVVLLSGLQDHGRHIKESRLLHTSSLPSYEAVTFSVLLLFLTSVFFADALLVFLFCLLCESEPDLDGSKPGISCCIVEKMSASPCLHGSLLLFCSFDELLACAILLARMWIAMVVMSPSRWRTIQQLEFPQVTGSSSLQQATPWWLLLYQGIQQQILTRKLLRTAVIAEELNNIIDFNLTESSNKFGHERQQRC